MDYGLWAVAIGCFFEGQVVLAGAGVLASHNLLNPLHVWLVGFISAWLGHLFWFALGKIMITRGLNLSNHNRYGKTIDRIDHLIRNKPWLSVFFLQYLYGTRLIGAIAFGFSNLKMKWFAAAQSLNCLIWALCVAGFGYIAGESFHPATTSPLRILWIVLTLGLLVVWWRIANRHSIRQRMISAVPDMMLTRVE